MSGAACFECGAPAEHDHHVVPRSRGGTRTIPLCTSCHGKAHHRSGNMAHNRLTSEALQRKRARGECTGNAPYGYRVGPDGVSLIEDDSEQTVILTVRELRAAGLSFRKVAEQLESRGFLSRTGRRLTHRAIANIVKSASRAPSSPQALD